MSATSLQGILQRRFINRFIWIMTVCICVIFTIGVGIHSWGRYRAVPTIIDVKETHHPLFSFPFPTVTICSGTRVKRGPAREILVRYLSAELPLKNKENILSYVMSMLSLLQFPSYHLIKPYLRTQESMQLLHQFADLNITDFMLQVMPTCTEVFHECVWHGIKVNCCEIFELQRTEQGFCWSFNSLTSDATTHCPLSEVLENEGIMEEDEDERLECELRRNTGISGGSGLQIFLRPADPQHNIGYRAQRVVNGVSVLIHTSYEFPVAGMGMFASTTRGARLSVGVAAEITTSSEGIRSLPVEDRHCVFPDERQLHIHHVYTQTSCLAECRYKFIMLMCRCKLYFFQLPEVRLPECGVLHLSCIAKHSSKFRFYKPPVDTPCITDRELMESLDCNCYSTCFDTVYDIHLQRSILQSPDNQTVFSLVDIYYTKTGFVCYQRHIVFEFNRLIVALGGAANLFLGCSLLSLIETIYWMLKTIAATIHTINLKNKVIKVHPVNYLT